jgi:hypothetical protein
MYLDEFLNPHEQEPTEVEPTAKDLFDENIHKVSDELRDIILNYVEELEDLIDKSTVKFQQ